MWYCIIIDIGLSESISFAAFIAFVVFLLSRAFKEKKRHLRITEVVTILFCSWIFLSITLMSLQG
jgi:predicted histidine transporter YuiF (NhaC family)